MTALVRLLFALTVALFVGALWATPSEAHAGHSPAATQKVEPAHDRVSVKAESAMVTRSADETSCASGDASDDGAVCCGHACHAAAPLEVMALPAVASARATTPEALEPAAHGGPDAHLMRPPRPVGSSAG